MLKKLTTIIELTDDQQNRMMPPKLIYNEDNLLRLVMYWFYHHDNFIINSDIDRIICKAFVCVDEARVYSHATIETPFKIRNKGEKDPLAEASSEVSGVVGHFKILMGKKKERVILENDASKFIVIEAALSKPLKKGSKNLKKYHQVVKDIGCMVQTLSKLENPYIENIGLFVLAPETLLKTETFRNYTYKPSVEELMKERLDAYSDDTEIHEFRDLFNKLFQRIDLECISFEDVIRFVKKNEQAFGEELEVFYTKCLLYHGLK